MRVVPVEFAGIQRGTRPMTRSVSVSIADDLLSRRQRASLKPEPLLFAENQISNNSIDNVERGIPSDITATQNRLARCPVLRVRISDVRQVSGPRVAAATEVESKADK